MKFPMQYKNKRVNSNKTKQPQRDNRREKNPRSLGKLYVDKMLLE